jgi:hypothetical protein
MNAKVYIVLNTVDKKPEQIAPILKTKTGVTVVDVLEGSPSLIMMLEAESRQELADLANEAIASVEAVTKSLQLLPVMVTQK